MINSNGDCDNDDGQLKQVSVELRLLVLLLLMMITFTIVSFVSIKLQLSSCKLSTAIPISTNDMIQFIMYTKPTVCKVYINQ